jgi:hypothetical protein
VTTWSPAYHAAWLTLFSSDLQVLNTGGGSSSGVLPGKALSTENGDVGQFFEITVNNVTTGGPPFQTCAVGIGRLDSDLSLGFEDGKGVGWYADGWLAGPGGFNVFTGVGWTTGDVLGVEWNSGGIKFYKGGTLAYTYTGSLPSGDLYAIAFLLMNPNEVTANFGDSAWAHDPGGITGWGVGPGGGRTINVNQVLPALTQTVSILSGSGPPPPPSFGTGGFFPDTIAEVLAGRTVRCDLLVFFDFVDAPTRLWQGFGTLHTNDDNDWEGIGRLGKVADLEAPTGTSSPSATFVLSGVDPTLVSAALDPDVIRNRDVFVYMQFFDEAMVPLDDPYVVWSGTMDTVNIKQSGPDLCTIEVTAEPPFIRRSFPPLGNLVDREQQMFFPGDVGLAAIPSLMSKVAIWPVIQPGFP